MTKQNLPKSDMPPVYERKLIYIFRINDDAHEGLLKIGDATIKNSSSEAELPPNCAELNFAARRRIDRYTKTANVSYELLHTELAVRPDFANNPVVFRDYEVHKVLLRTSSKYRYRTVNGGQEWFRVDLETAKRAIRAVKERRNCLSEGRAYVEWSPVVFRSEQLEAIEKTVKYFKGRNNTRFLWNAKMRFGKTLCALETVRRLGFKHTIIITHRPAVNEGWYEDFKKIFGGEQGEGYLFGTKDRVEVGTPWSELKRGEHPFVYFASIQDLRGSDQVGGKFAKNSDVFGFPWDLVIVDEAHEGTQTLLGDAVIKNLLSEGEATGLSATKLLALSGTPFNIAEQYEDNCFTWDYVMEQKRKAELEGLGLSNPYAELPEMRMMTFSLAEEFKGYEQFQDKAFNFSEFFRVDESGNFVHEDDVKRFLDLLCQPGQSGYPFSCAEYRRMFRHTFWIIPGVREAKALQVLLEAHSAFACFKVCNVAGKGNIEDNALQSVRDSIKNNAYTITLSCGKLTTGVTVPEWSAVLYLAGTTSTSAQSYMQTIFRVQSPCNSYGMSKTRCYVFDFAPDRTLKLVSEAVAKGSYKPGNTSEDNRRALAEFLNFCPIVSVSAGSMRRFDIHGMMRKLKNAYAERAVRNGFEDVKLYNRELWNLDDGDRQLFKYLGEIVRRSNLRPLNKVDINSSGFDEEIFSSVEPASKLSKMPKKGTPEYEEAKKERLKAIDTLRAISIRIPLLIYGAVVSEGSDKDTCDCDITLNWLLENIDDTSWEEFMPKGVTKDIFAKLAKYYDEDIFLEAGRQIRAKVRDADEELPLVRINRIIELLSCFKNPDKETVLTPWRVVNMHLSDCLGGYDWFEVGHSALSVDEQGIPKPRWIDKGRVSQEVWDDPNVKILEINSKTGVYPLYATFSVFARKCYDAYCRKIKSSNIEAWKRDIPLEDILKLVEQRRLWRETVEDNIFVLCKTPMALAITRRTLLGFDDCNDNLRCYPGDLLSDMRENLPKVVETLKSEKFWNRGNRIMKFEAVVGNPPFSAKDGGAGESSTPLYPMFVEVSKNLNPKYFSLIIPCRWYSGGKGKATDRLREYMLNEKHIAIFHDFILPTDVFPNTNIRGGICYFLYDAKHDEQTHFFNHFNNFEVFEGYRPMRFGNEQVFIRYAQAQAILNKIKPSLVNSFSDHISSRKPFGLDTNFSRGNLFKAESISLVNPIKCYAKSYTVGYIERSEIQVHKDWIDVWKLIIPRANNIGTELNDDNLNAMVVPPNVVCTESYLIVGASLQLNENDAKNIVSYFRTKFARFLHSMKKSSQDVTPQSFEFVPLQDFTSASDIDWSQPISEIDRQLYQKYNLAEDEIAFIENTIKPMK